MTDPISALLTLVLAGLLLVSAVVGLVGVAVLGFLVVTGALALVQLAVAAVRPAERHERRTPSPRQDEPGNLPD